RLILADGIIRAGDLGAKYIVDIATLTGAVANALGSKIAGVFGDEELSARLKEIGESNGDRVWPLPLMNDYARYLDSDYADLCNISSKGEAGAITAALFLRR
ncbi:leucyl aminopeptidase family protein, partial [Butyricicoccus sp. 1XD8-22]